MDESWKSQLIESRKNSGLSIEEISTKTKIPIKNIIAIEQGSFDELPAEIFTKSQIQNLSKLLNIDPKVILKEYENFLKSKIEEDSEDSDKESSRNIKNFLDNANNWLKTSQLLSAKPALILFLILISAVYLYQQFTYEETEEAIKPSIEEDLIGFYETQEENQTSEINPEKKEESIIINDSSKIKEASSIIESVIRKIEIIIDGESWIVVFDKKERLLYELMQTGNYNLEGVSPIVFKVGYAPATKIFIDGKKLNFSRAIKGSTNYAHFKVNDDSTIESIRD